MEVFTRLYGHGGMDGRTTGVTKTITAVIMAIMDVQSKWLLTFTLYSDS